MGFQHKPQRINVSFEPGHDLHGLEVVLRKLTLGEYLDIIGLGEVGMNHIGDQLKAMGDKLISWNLEDDNGQPVPATPEAVLGQDKDLMVTILEAWLEALNGVAAPLEQSSPAGEPSLEASIPMETLSNALVS